MKVSTENDNNFGYEKNHDFSRQYPFKPAVCKFLHVLMTKISLLTINYVSKQLALGFGQVMMETPMKVRNNFALKQATKTQTHCSLGCCATGHFYKFSKTDILQTHTSPLMEFIFHNSYASLLELAVYIQTFYVTVFRVLTY